jgi:DNA-binding MarR family transcriptional regulator
VSPPRSPSPDKDVGGAHERPASTRSSPRRGLRGVRGGLEPESPLALDRLIHERIRLGIVSALAVNESLTFVALKALLHTTDGNLSVHARKLEEAGYIVCTKGFEGRLPRTEYRLTRAGRKAFERYVDHMEAIIAAARGSGEPRRIDKWANEQADE